MTAGSSKRSTIKGNTRSLMIRLDDESKACLSRAAGLRNISVSDYVRTVTVAQARRELAAAQENTFVLTPDEQSLFGRP
jgi:uncharacterized protein (DUF1778 family)